MDQQCALPFGSRANGFGDFIMVRFTRQPGKDT